MTDLFPLGIHFTLPNVFDVFADSSRIVSAYRFDFTQTWGVEFMGYQLLGAAVSDSVTVNLYGDNGSNHPDFGTLVLAGADTGPFQGSGFPGVSLTHLVEDQAKNFGPQWFIAQGSSPRTVATGTYWVVATVVSGSTHSNIFSFAGGFYSEASPTPIKAGPNTGSLSTAPSDANPGPTGPYLWIRATTPAVAAAYSYAAVIG